MKKTKSAAIPSKLATSVHNFLETWKISVAGNGRPPGLIYHYCDANALLNIFRTKSMWATGTRYLNDSSELVSALRNLNQTTEKHRKSKTGELLTSLTEVMRTAGVDLLSRAIGMESYVTCFSEDPDILSQWRAYADDGLGFAIGFNAQKLRVLDSSSPGVKIKRIVYAGQEEQNLIDDLFYGLGAIIKPYLPIFGAPGEKLRYDSSQPRTWLSVRLSEALYEITIQCKHRSFQEEKEWRITTAANSTQFRSSRGRIVPYTILDMTSSENHSLMPIEKIVIGPKADRLDTERVLMYLGEEYGYGHSGFEILQSDAPYR
ncbi:MAG TPA: DUF2971 domain-containing protein [Candidatus Angelobacter sp.]|jgi:hypothetical protein|nr:DUF2971 domain-containing protein [Candidatus Angelobacter sp.]